MPEAVELRRGAALRLLNRVSDGKFRGAVDSVVLASDSVVERRSQSSDATSKWLCINASIHSLEFQPTYMMTACLNMLSGVVICGCQRSHLESRLSLSLCQD